MEAGGTNDGIRPLLRELGQGPTSGRSLTREEARYCLDLILDGVSTQAQAGAFLLLERYKGETPEELLGFVDAILGRGSTTALEHDLEGVLDIGSPYDGRLRTTSVSVPASLVAAAAGVPVVLHGEPGVPPKHGYTIGDILSELGIDTHRDAQGAARELADLGIAYIAQSQFAPDVAALKTLREELALRTPLNMVEKIYDPARAAYHLIGLTHVPYLEKLAGALAGMGFRKTALVQGMEGSEDLPTNRGVRIIEASPAPDGQDVRQYRIKADDFGLEPLSNERLAEAPTAHRSAALAREVLGGEVDAAWRDLVVFNAGFRIYLAERAQNIADGVRIAGGILRSRDPERILQRWQAGA